MSTRVCRKRANVATIRLSGRIGPIERAPASLVLILAALATIAALPHPAKADCVGSSCSVYAVADTFISNDGYVRVSTP